MAQLSTPNLDHEGNPCPPLLEALSLTEFEQRHVRAHEASTSRAQIFSMYQRYLRDIRAVLGVGFKQWVDGSFTTSKRDPSDIDLLNFVPYSAAANDRIAELFPFLKTGGSVEKYRVDGHLIAIYPPDDPRYYLTQLNMNYWASKFGFDEQRGAEKMVVELLIP